MRLNGNHVLQAPVRKVWDMLLDPDVLTRITPGVTSLEPLGDRKYKAISEIKMGPVNGSFKGDIEVADLVEPEHFTLRMKQTGKIGNVAAEGIIHLSPVNGNQTEVKFEGKAKVSGTLARTGQRVLGGVANTMTNQFFSALEDEINASMGIVKEKTGWWYRVVNWFRMLFGNK